MLFNEKVEPMNSPLKKQALVCDGGQSKQITARDQGNWGVILLQVTRLAQ